MRGPGPSPPQRGGRLNDLDELSATLPALFHRGRPVDADAAGLLEVPGGPCLTYGDADRRSAQVAHALVRSGVGPGDRVAIGVAKCPEAIVVYLACLRSGAVVLPMNPAYTAEEVAHLVGDAEPAIVVDEPELARLVKEAADLPERFDDVDVGPDDPAAILYTSGTTGRPKGAVLSHRNLATNAAVLRRIWEFRPDDVLLHALPLYHAHGLFVGVNTVLAAGARMVFLPRFDVEAVLEALPRCTVMMGVPTYYTRLLDDPRFGPEPCSRMRLFLSGSAPLLASTHERFRSRTGHAVLERYGMTETLMLTSNPLHGERRAGTVGFPLPGTELRIATDGVIEVHGPSVFAGYWRRPELAATEFSPDGWFRTGDLGEHDADGYIRIIGRAKDLVISGGLNVYPKEVEDVIDTIDGVLESAVVGVPDDDLGEAVVAVVVAEAGRALDPDAVRAEARTHLAGFKAPKRVEIVAALPRNAMGKVEKATLRQRFS